MDVSSGSTGVNRWRLAFLVAALALWALAAYWSRLPYHQFRASGMAFVGVLCLVVVVVSFWGPRIFGATSSGGTERSSRPS